MMDNVKEYNPKCPFCKKIVTKPNKLIEILEHSKICLICHEKQTHKMIISYLVGETSETFMCGEDGCSIIIPERDYLQYHPDDELLDELKRRLEGTK